MLTCSHRLTHTLRHNPSPTGTFVSSYTHTSIHTPQSYPLVCPQPHLHQCPRWADTCVGTNKSHTSLLLRGTYTLPYSMYTCMLRGFICCFTSSAAIGTYMLILSSYTHSWLCCYTCGHSHLYAPLQDYPSQPAPYMHTCGCTYTLIGILTLLRAHTFTSTYTPC